MMESIKFWEDFTKRQKQDEKRMGDLMFRESINNELSRGEGLRGGIPEQVTSTVTTTYSPPEKVVSELYYSKDLDPIGYEEKQITREIRNRLRRIK